jgi:hypothetical protein
MVGASGGAGFWPSSSRPVSVCHRTKSVRRTRWGASGQAAPNRSVFCVSVLDAESSFSLRWGTVYGKSLIDTAEKRYVSLDAEKSFLLKSRIKIEFLRSKAHFELEHASQYEMQRIGRYRAEEKHLSRLGFGSRFRAARKRSFSH